MNNLRKVTIRTSKNAIYVFEEYRTFISIDIETDQGIKVVIDIDSEFMIMLCYNFLKELWLSRYYADTEILLGDRVYRLDDKNIERDFYYYSLTDEILEEFPAPGLLVEVINENKIKKFKQLHKLTEVKFSGLLAYNENDQVHNTKKYGVVLDKNKMYIPSNLIHLHG